MRRRGLFGPEPDISTPRPCGPAQKALPLDLFPLWGDISRLARPQSGGAPGGCSSMVEQKLPKLKTRVRFPSPAPAYCPSSPTI